MTYQIIIALRGQHFLTADLKTHDRATAERRFRQVAAKFSASLGYSVELTEWSMPSGTSLARQEATQ